MSLALHLSRWVALAWLAASCLLPAHAQPSAAVGSEASKPITFSKDIPLKRDAPAGPVESGGGVQVFFLLVIGLAAVALYVYTRRRGPGGGTSARGQARGPAWLNRLGGILPAAASRASASDPVVIHRKRLDRQHTLYVIEWNNTQYLVGAGDSHLSLVASKGSAAPDQNTPEVSP